jgi:hypothetical protein
MPVRASRTGSELFIVDNSDTDWKVQRYLRDWCQISKSIDIATGNFEIGGLLALEDEWQKVDQIRILMGAGVTLRTSQAFVALASATGALDERSASCEWSDRRRCKIRCSRPPRTWASNGNSHP